MDYEEFFEGPEEDEEERIPDKYFLEVQKEIKDLYDQDRESVYYLRQLQIKYEKKYFHWITYHAVNELYNFGYLKDFRTAVSKGTSTRYFFHKSNRYARRKIKEIEAIVREYSQDHITRSCGHRAEDLFCKALAMRGFMPTGQKVNIYNSRKWKKTGHDLDFVFTKDKIAYGCEIKNKLSYIEKEELEIKLDMCDYLGIKPLFIMRSSPKTYNKMIIERGGFALLYEAQIYELSQESLVKKMKKVLGLPVVCSKAIPDGIIDRFENWHNKNF